MPYPIQVWIKMFCNLFIQNMSLSVKKKVHTIKLSTSKTTLDFASADKANNNQSDLPDRTADAL